MVRVGEERKGIEDNVTDGKKREWWRGASKLWLHIDEGGAEAGGGTQRKKTEGKRARWQRANKEKRKGRL